MRSRRAENSVVAASVGLGQCLAQDRESWYMVNTLFDLLSPPGTP